MSVMRAGLNALRARLRVARAIRILELERTRRRLRIAALILAFWLGCGVLIALDSWGLVAHSAP